MRERIHRSADISCQHGSACLQTSTFKHSKIVQMSSFNALTTVMCDLLIKLHVSFTMCSVGSGQMCVSSTVCSRGKRLSTGSLTSTSWSKDTDLQTEELSCQLGLEPVKDVWKSTWCWEGTFFYWAGWQSRDILEKGHISYIITPWGCVREVCINLPRIDARIYIFFSYTQADTIQWKKSVRLSFYSFFLSLFLSLFCCVRECECVHLL